MFFALLLACLCNTVQSVADEFVWRCNGQNVGMQLNFMAKSMPSVQHDENEDINPWRSYVCYNYEFSYNETAVGEFCSQDDFDVNVNTDNDFLKVKNLMVGLKCPNKITAYDLELILTSGEPHIPSAFVYHRSHKYEPLYGYQWTMEKDAAHPWNIFSICIWESSVTGGNDNGLYFIRTNRFVATGATVVPNLCSLDAFTDSDSSSEESSRRLSHGGLNEIRLRGGSDSSNGRVEYYDGNWQSICGESWGSRECSVVCRELGFSATGAIPQVGVYGGSQTYGSYLTVQCNGDENRLSHCSINYLDRYSCSRRYDDAGCDCQGGANSGSGSGSSGGNFHAHPHGRRVLYHTAAGSDSGARPVHHHHHHGHRHPHRHPHRYPHHHHGHAPHHHHPAPADSSSNVPVHHHHRHRHPHRRPHRHAHTHPHAHPHTHRHRHHHTPPPPASDSNARRLLLYPFYETRLNGGRNALSGRVEYRFQGGMWNWICGTSLWGIQECRVACGELGHNGNVATAHVGSFGGSLTHQSDLSVQCTGNEASLSQCKTFTTMCTKRHQAGCTCGHQGSGDSSSGTAHHYTTNYDSSGNVFFDDFDVFDSSGFGYNTHYGGSGSGSGSSAKRRYPRYPNRHYPTHPSSGQYNGGSSDSYPQYVYYPSGSSSVAYNPVYYEPHLSSDSNSNDDSSGQSNSDSSDATQSASEHQDSHLATSGADDSETTPTVEVNTNNIVNETAAIHTDNTTTANGSD